MTRRQNEALRTASALFYLLVLGSGFALLCVVGGCGETKTPSAPHVEVDAGPPVSVVGPDDELDAGIGGPEVASTGGAQATGGATGGAAVSTGGAGGQAMPPATGGAPVATGGASTGGASTGGAPGTGGAGVAVPPLRVLPAGDSICQGTDVNGGYRGPLFAALGARAIPVGPRDSAVYGGGPGFHACYPGIHTTSYAGYIPGFLATYRPSVVLLMLGTNGDNWGPEYVRDLVRPTLDADPAVRLLVGAIPATPAQGDYPHAFNVSLEAALRAVPEFGTRLWFVPETETAARPDEYGEDMFHPAAPGYARIADAWMVGLVRAGLVSP